METADSDPTNPLPTRSSRGRLDALLRRFIDGRPGEPRTITARRAKLLVSIATGLANVGGALVVLLFAAFIAPDPGTATPRIRLINLIVFTAYVVASAPVGMGLGLRSFRRIRRLLEQDRAPDSHEQLLLLYAPLRLTAVHLTLWAIGSICWTIFNLWFSPLLALKVGLTSALGALTTCTIVYLVAERLLRPVVTAALTTGMPRGTELPGVVSRSLLAWGLGTAVPVLGLISLAAGSLMLKPMASDTMAVGILALGGTALVVGFGIAYVAARAISDPVESVRLAMSGVERGDLSAEVPVYDGSEIGLLQAGFNHMVAGLREHERLRDLFGRQVGVDVAQVALERGVDLGGELREVAVIFVDVIGSTRLASLRPPTEVVKLLNEFFAVVVEVVGRHGGWINKFEGDAALAVFGAPLALADAPTRALAAGRELAVRLRDEVPGLQAAVGISAGEAVAGHVGAEERFEYTVIGDPVNEAARLTDLAKTTPARLLAAERVVADADPAEAAHWCTGDEVTLRGRTSPTRTAAPLPA